MSSRDVIQAALTSVVWGFGFVAIKLGLEGLSAPPPFWVATKGDVFGVACPVTRSILNWRMTSPPRLVTNT